MCAGVINDLIAATSSTRQCCCLLLSSLESLKQKYFYSCCERELTRAENEQIQSVCFPLAIGALLFRPAYLEKKDKPKLQNNCPSFLIQEIKYELVTFEILSLVMWRAVTTCEEVTSPLLSGIFIPEEIGLSWTERRVPAGQ